jgi:hypothetical protein
VRSFLQGAQSIQYSPALISLFCRLVHPSIPRGFRILRLSFLPRLLSRFGSRRSQRRRGVASQSGVRFLWVRQVIKNPGRARCFYGAVQL